MYDVVQEMSGPMTKTIVKRVNSTYGLHLIIEKDSKFIDMDDAKEFLDWNFAYHNHVEQRSLFKFEYPESCKHYLQPVIDYNKLDIDLYSIEQIYDTKWLNDVSINLFMELLNLAIISTSKKTVVPEFVFGSTFNADLFIQIQPGTQIFKKR